MSVYDSFSTYAVNVREGASAVTNQQVRQRLYKFETPIELTCTARRLTKGEAFLELNNMINELMRVFGTFQKEEIFGVQGITLDEITPIEGVRHAGKTVWQRTFKITLHYFKQDVS